jgi:hypothetical protein
MRILVKIRGQLVFPGEFGKAERRTADPSTTLRSGRDDNFAWER